MPHPHTLAHRIVLLCLAAALPTAGSTAVAQRAPSSPPVAGRGGESLAPGRAGSGPLRVLFVGNSYTYYHDLPGLVAQIAAVAGESRPLTTAQVTAGGATLEGHLRSGEAARAIAGGAWDVVVLQEQSLRPLEAPDAMLRSVRTLADLVSGAGARLMLYETWVRQATPWRQDSLSAAYRRAAERVDAQVVPAGQLWSRLGSTVSAAGGTLYDADGSHPSALGSYVAAAALYTALYGRPAPLLDSLMIPLQNAAVGEGAARRSMGIAPGIAAAVRDATAGTLADDLRGAGPATTTSSAPPFPAEWIGRWVGELEIFAADGSLRMRVPMVQEIGGAVDSTGYPFRTTYGDGAAASVRDYRLRAVAGGTANAFVIDERNGIALDARRFGASLTSVFRVGDRMLQTAYTFAGDELRFEVLFWEDVPQAAMHGQGPNGERGAEVRTFIPTGRQVARLRRNR